MHISKLTIHHVVLIRFTLSFWVPCSNLVTVSNLDFMWFQLTIGAQVDMTDFILGTNYVFVWKGKSSILPLCFPIWLYMLKRIDSCQWVDWVSTIGLAFKFTEKSSQGKSFKKLGCSSFLGLSDASPAAIASSSVTTELATLNARLTRMENCQSQILRKIVSILDSLRNDQD